MQQIKEKQAEKESGAWERLELQQRQETERDFRHMTMLARFHNLMANDSIHSLELLTRENKEIFTHKVMVDRIVAMLNYFLLHLVSTKNVTPWDKISCSHNSYIGLNISVSRAHPVLQFGEN